MAGSTVKTSYVPGEVRASVVAALLAVRHPRRCRRGESGLRRPTLAFRCGRCGVGWRLPSQKTGSVLSPVRASWSSRMILSSWLITAATCPALRAAPLAAAGVEHRPDAADGGAPATPAPSATCAGRADGDQARCPPRRQRLQLRRAVRVGW